MRTRTSRQDGMTLLEVVTVIALVALIGGCAAAASIGGYRQALYHSDRSSLIALLEHARAEAMDGVCSGATCTLGMSHGVSIQPDRYVLFQGSSYAARDSNADIAIDADPSVIHTGLSEAVFASFSGMVASPGTIMLTDASGRTSTVTITDEGQISWSN